MYPSMSDFEGSSVRVGACLFVFYYFLKKGVHNVFVCVLLFLVFKKGFSPIIRTNMQWILKISKPFGSSCLDPSIKLDCYGYVLRALSTVLQRATPM